jgi:hypothetical protein
MPKSVAKFWKACVLKAARRYATRGLQEGQEASAMRCRDQVESSLERKSYTRRLEDLTHYLSLDWRFLDILGMVKNVTPRPQRDIVIDDFWKYIYSGYYTKEADLLRARARALSEYIGTLDEMNKEHRGSADA